MSGTCIELSICCDDFVETEFNSSVEIDVDGDAESTVDRVPLGIRLHGTNSSATSRNQKV